MKKPFLPEKLPVKIDYLPLIPAITKAHAALARLDAMLDQLANPRILERSFLTHEAVQSSKIEGTQATLQEVLQFEVEQHESFSQKKQDDIEEVLNYRKALEYGIKKIDEGFPLTENLFKELHDILLTSARGHNKAPGEFRRGQVFIGSETATINEASYIPPEAHNITDLFSNLELYLNKHEEQDTLVQLAIAHYQFEAIHPFWDGNGRVGRLLITLYLYKKGLLKKPWLYLSEYFEKHRQKYYRLLREVSDHHAFSAWIQFFLKGVEYQSLDACTKVKHIQELETSIKSQVVQFGSVYALRFAEALFVRPIFTRISLQKVAKIKTYQTLSNLMEKFLKANIIQAVDEKQQRNKVYAFSALIKLITQ